MNLHICKDWTKKCMIIAVIIMTVISMIQPQIGLAHASTTTGNLTIHVVGMKNDKGVVRISLYNTPSSYTTAYKTESRANAYRTAALPINGNHATWQIKNIPAGEYALLFMHDEYKDGHMHKNVVGIPQEGYGFSVDNTSKLQVPSFDKAKFNVDSQQHTITVYMRYW